jgi:ubiquinone/menaquinone biosynthesis C-methylase UbiE
MNGCSGAFLKAPALVIMQNNMELKDTGERLVVSEGSQNDPNYNRHMAAYTFATRFIKDKIVLDSGSGSGYGTYYLATQGAKKVIGIDKSEEATAYSRSKHICTNLEFTTCDVTAIKYPDEFFDVVTSFQVIEHLKEPEKLLAEVKRVLKKSGTALIATPNKRISSPNTLRPGNPFHEIEFFFDDFRRLVGKYFDNVEIFGVNQSAKMEQLTKQREQSLYVRLEKLSQRIRVIEVAKNIVPKCLRRSLAPADVKSADQSDFYVAESNPEVSLDFLAVCKKI